jgi:hypothetical protein
MGLPPLVTHILRSAAIGSALGVVFAGLLLASDVGGIRSLLSAAGEGFAAVALLAVGFATLFGSLYAGAAIMTLPD